MVALIDGMVSAKNMKAYPAGLVIGISRPQLGPYADVSSVGHKKRTPDAITKVANLVRGSP
jgi:hypothetical protein